MNEFVGLRTKTYSYLKDKNDGDKQVKNTKSKSWKENLNLKIIKTV